MSIFHWIPRYHPFLAFQLSRTILQFTVLFKINIALKVFSKLRKPIVQVLSHLSIEKLMYLNSWLNQAPDCQQYEAHRDFVLDLSCHRGFLFSFGKSHLTPIQTIT